jgi:hypothetical protein
MNTLEGERRRKQLQEQQRQRRKEALARGKYGDGGIEVLIWNQAAYFAMANESHVDKVLALHRQFMAIWKANSADCHTTGNATSSRGNTPRISSNNPNPTVHTTPANTDCMHCKLLQVFERHIGIEAAAVALDRLAMKWPAELGWAMECICDIDEGCSNWEGRGGAIAAGNDEDGDEDGGTLGGAELEPNVWKYRWERDECDISVEGGDLTDNSWPNSTDSSGRQSPTAQLPSRGHSPQQDRRDAQKDKRNKRKGPVVGIGYTAPEWDPADSMGTVRLVHLAFVRILDLLLGQVVDSMENPRVKRGKGGAAKIQHGGSKKKWRHASFPRKRSAKAPVARVYAHNELVLGGESIVVGYAGVAAGPTGGPRLDGLPLRA